MDINLLNQINKFHVDKFNKNLKMPNDALFEVIIINEVALIYYLIFKKQEYNRINLLNNFVEIELCSRLLDYLEDILNVLIGIMNDQYLIMNII